MKKKSQVVLLPTNVEAPNSDNTINIDPIKNSWNREEFEIAIRETWRVACSDTYKASSPELEDEWVNEILK